LLKRWSHRIRHAPHHSGSNALDVGAHLPVELSVTRLGVLLIDTIQLGVLLVDIRRLVLIERFERQGWCARRSL